MRRVLGPAATLAPRARRTAGRVDPDGACGVKIGLGAIENGVWEGSPREYPCIRGGAGLDFAFYAEGCCRGLMFRVLT